MAIYLRFIATAALVVGVATAQPTEFAYGNALTQGTSTDFLRSGPFRFGMDSNGDLILAGAFGQEVTVIASGGLGSRVSMQGDGNMVLYRSDDSVAWVTRTVDNHGAVARLDANTGFVEILAVNGQIIRTFRPDGCVDVFLRPNRRLNRGEYVCYGNTRFGLTDTGDVIYQVGSSVTTLLSFDSDIFVMQLDGNFVLYRGSVGQCGTDTVSGRLTGLYLTDLNGPRLVNDFGVTVWDLSRGFSCSVSAPTRAPTPAPTRPPGQPICKSTRGTSDPHFRTWNGFFSYQGQCEMIFVSTPEVEVHIQTTFGGVGTFSFISSVAIAAGTDVLEVRSDRSYLFNGATPTIRPASVGANRLTVGPNFFVVELPAGQSIRITFYRSTITIDITGCENDFGNSVGISGSFTQAGVLGRDGTTVLGSPREIAEEWAVDTQRGDRALLLEGTGRGICAEPVAFTPTPEVRQIAEDACAGLPNDQSQRDDCIFDVIATGGQPEWADNPGFTEPLTEEPSCFNGNPCLIGTLVGNECEFTPLECPAGESCNPLDGVCQPTNEVVPCVAVIDESDTLTDTQVDNLWARFRSEYPNRPFCLLQPPPSSNSGGRLYVPDAFLSDPLTTFDSVIRDNGNRALASDWYNICGYADLISNGIEFVGIFIDDSGSLTVPNVQGSIDVFQAELAANGLTSRSLDNPNEDWITPFITVLA